MTEIDFSDLELPPDELKKVRQRYREERRAEEERLAGASALLRQRRLRQERAWLVGIAAAADRSGRLMHRGKVR